jgi:hypothetical protein
MSYKDATAYAASLAATLMVSIVVFQAGDGTHAAMPSDEYDGDETLVALEIDPRSGKRHRTEGSDKGEVEGGAGRASPLRQRERRRTRLFSLSMENPK